MKGIIKVIAITCVSSTFIMTKCGKDRPKVDDETQTIQDNVLSEQEFMRVIPQTNDRAIKQKGIGSSGKIMGNGDTAKFEYHDSILSAWNTIDNNTPLSVFNQILATVQGIKVFTPSIDSVKITLAYDPNTAQPDGRNKSGRIITYMTKNGGAANIPLFGEVGGQYTTKFDNYKANSINYAGTIDVNSISNTIMTTKVNNGSCSKAGEWNTSYSNLSARKINASNNGEEYRIEEADPNGGGTVGTSRDGTSYTLKITSPLTFNSKAKYGIIGGIVQLTPDGKKTRTIDYSQISAGVVLFTVDGNSFTVTLSQ
jgi:hypothetical protein